MKNDFITIQESAELSGKSVQTIRRAVKSKKLKVKKTKTPQGFNYLVSQSSLVGLYKIKIQPSTKAKNGGSTNQTTSQKSKKKAKQSEEISLFIKREEMVEFHKTLQQITHEHSQERQNYLRLVQALQEKITVLENQFKLLQESGQKKWFHFWK